MEKLKHFIKANQSALVIAAVILILVFGWFYWYEWRPSQIRKECAEIANVKSGNFLPLREEVEGRYYNCLRKNGLEK